MLCLNIYLYHLLLILNEIHYGHAQVLFEFY